METTAVNSNSNNNLIDHKVKVYPSKVPLAKEEQLAYKMAQVASTPFSISESTKDMIINRIIDNASVAIASLKRTPVVSARAQALCHPHTGKETQGATIFGISQLVSPEWAAWANGTAVRELDFHDTYLAADYSHPGDNIPPILAVCQHKKLSGKDLLRGLAVAYELHINLVKGICLHEHKKDHIAHLCPAQAAGIGAALGLDTEIIYQAIQQALHVSFSTRQSRKGEISSWKAFAPAHAAKLAIEAVDRCMRGEKAPSPIYEGEDSVISYMLGGKSAEYTVPLPKLNTPYESILLSYTKAHSAEYQSQALIDLAFELRTKVENWDDVEEIIIETSHHTHYVIGTGAQDPQKMDPNASRETLDHSIMYIFAVALEDGRWHHVDSYTRKRAQTPSTVKLWQKIKTIEKKEWTDLYHHKDPNQKAFGGKAIIHLKNGTKIEGELNVAHAHPNGKKPFARQDYIGKFMNLTTDILTSEEQKSFIEKVENLETLDSLLDLNIVVSQEELPENERNEKGIF